VASHPAVGVHDDLAAREPRVALRPTDDEASGRIDVVVILPFRRSSGISGSITSSMMVFRIFFALTPSSCCVEITTVSTATG
jgi:hypothetical protein